MANGIIEDLELETAKNFLLAADEHLVQLRGGEEPHYNTLTSIARFLVGQCYDGVFTPEEEQRFRHFIFDDPDITDVDYVSCADLNKFDGFAQVERHFATINKLGSHRRGPLSKGDVVPVNLNGEPLIRTLGSTIVNVTYDAKYQAHIKKPSLDILNTEVSVISGDEEPPLIYKFKLN